MGNPSAPNRTTIQAKGWLHATRWLLMRRASQLSILGLFLLGPLADVWIIKGNLSASLLLETIPMTDPHLLLQAMLSGEMPVTSGLLGGLIILVFYAIVGGRVFCSWVCPVNMVSDAAAWMRRKLGISTGSGISRKTRYWMLAATFALAVATGSIAWELINPVSMAHRGIIFGMGLAWVVLLGVFLFDLLISKHGWCGRVCPVGAFYSLVGHKSLLRIAATHRSQCDDCMDCFNICPEPQVIKPALKGEAKGLGPVILDSDCTNCGRCIDVCDKDVFTLGTRWSRKVITRAVEQHAAGR